MFLFAIDQLTTTYPQYKYYLKMCNNSMHFYPRLNIQNKCARKPASGKMATICPSLTQTTYYLAYRFKVDTEDDAIKH